MIKSDLGNEKENKKDRVRKEIYLCDKAITKN
jgi:hypothetical protein